MDGSVWTVKKAKWTTYRLINSGLTSRGNELQKSKRQSQRGGEYKERSEQDADGMRTFEVLCVLLKALRDLPLIFYCLRLKISAVIWSALYIIKPTIRMSVDQEIQLCCYTFALASSATIGWGKCRGDLSAWNQSSKALQSNHFRP